MYNLLVVDDDALLRELIAEDLEARGYKTFVAGNAKEAITVLGAQSIDLVISDIRMPGGDGISLLKFIQENNKGVPPLVFMTGFSDIPDSECLEKGARKVFSKPLNRDEFFSSIEGLLK